MYDFSEEEESNLPLPHSWIRTVDTHGNLQYKDLELGVLSEEHPYIIKALNASRKLPLPRGWSVKEAYVQGGEKDYFYYNSVKNVSGWDPPQLRYCLSQCLERDGHVGAANAVMTPNSLSDAAADNFVLGGNIDRDMTDIVDSDSVQAMSGDPDHPARISSSPPKVKSYDWMGLMQQIGNIEDKTRGHCQLRYEMRSSVQPHSDDTTFDDEDMQQLTDKESVYSRSLISESSRISKRSRHWIDIHEGKLMRRQQTQKGHRWKMVKIPEAVTTDSVMSMSAILTELNEQVHELLVELRVAFCHRQTRPFNVLAYTVGASADSMSIRECSGYPQDVVNEVVVLADNMTTLVRGRVDILVTCLSVVPLDSPELTLLVFTVLHRLYHPFSADSSLTTAFLLETLNFEIDRVCADVGAEVFSTDLSGLRTLLCSLLTDISVEYAATVFQPLMFPLFSTVPFAKRFPFTVPQTDHDDTTPRHSLLSQLLRCYAIRRDVSGLFRSVWRQNIPAIVSMIDMAGRDTGSHGRPKGSETTVSMTNLIQLSGRIIESVFLDEVLMIFPATATAMARCFADLCGRDGTYIYMLDFLILPNIVKLVIGDHDSADNEDIFDQAYLRELSRKYFDHGSWWPIKGKSYTEEEHFSTVRILDPGGMLVWFVWRVYSVAVYSDPAEVTTLTAREFFAPLDINPLFTGVPDTKIRSIVGRMRMKINKGCGYMLELPLDCRGSDFLDVHTDLAVRTMKVHTQQMAKMLRQRLNALMLKPPEATNATVISRHDSMILFDSLAYVLEDQLDDLEMSTDEEDLRISESFEFSSALLKDIQYYLYLCDYLDSTVEDGGAENEDIMFLWSNPPSRAPISDVLSDVSYSLPTNRFSADEPWNEYGKHASERERGDDDSTVDSALAPPPPPPSDTDYDYNQLARAIMLANRYIDNLHMMLTRVNTNQVCSLQALLADDIWFKSPEVDVASVHPFEADGATYDKATESAHHKCRPSHYGFGADGAGMVSKSNGFESRQAAHEKFFKTFRFPDNGKTATFTSLGMYAHKEPQRIINNLLPPTKLALHIPNPGSLKGKKTAVSFRHRNKTTKVTLPDNSPLLVPTVSYAQQKEKRETWQDMEHKFIMSLRDPIVVNSKPDCAVHKRTVNSSAEHLEVHRVSNAIPFPEHLRTRVRGSAAPREEYMEKEYETRFQEDIPVSAAKRAGIDGSDAHSSKGSRPFNYGARKRERTMPSKGGFGVPAAAYVPTESRLNQLNCEENDDDMEITVEQEKGWAKLLRNYDARSESSSVASRPFKPSGSVSPDIFKHRRHRVPRHLRPGQNRQDVRNRRPHGPGGRGRGRLLRQPSQASDHRGSVYDNEDNGDGDCDDNEGEVETTDSPEFETMSVHDFMMASAVYAHPGVPLPKLSHSGTRPVTTDSINITPCDQPESSGGHCMPQQESSESENEESKSHLLGRGNSANPSFCAGTVAFDRTEDGPWSYDGSNDQHLHIGVSSNVKRPSPSTDAEILSAAGADAHYIPCRAADPGENVAERDFASLSTSGTPSPVRPPALKRSRSVEAKAPAAGTVTFEFEAPAGSILLERTGVPPVDKKSNTDITEPALSISAHESQYMASTGALLPSAVGRLNVLARRLQREQEASQAPQMIPPSEDHDPSIPADLQVAESDTPRRKLTSSYSFVARRKQSPQAPPESPCVGSLSMGALSRPDESGISEISGSRQCDTSANVDDDVSCSSHSKWRQDSTDPNDISSAFTTSPRKVPVLQRSISQTKSSLKQMLATGYRVSKHGSSGYPKDKIVYMDSDRRALIWKPAKGSLLTMFTKQSAESSISLSDITEVRRGVQTDILMKGGLVDPGRSLSLITPYRSLDFVFSTKLDRENFARSIGIVLEDRDDIIFR